MNEEVETKVKLAIYEITAETGRVPNSSDVSRKIDIDEEEVLGAFGRLHAKRLILPEPGDPSRIRMAPPFSGIPTKFPVEANGKQYFANCVWDAYGIAAARGTPTQILPSRVSTLNVFRSTLAGP